MFPVGAQRSLYEALLRYDEAAFEHLYKLMYKRLSTYVWRANGTSQQARELTQEAIIAFLFQLKNGQYQWREEAELTTYVMAIARNIWRYQQRKDKQLLPIPDNDELPDISSPEDELTFEGRRVAVEHALAQLGEKCRQAIQLYYWQRLSMNEIARLLNWASESVARKEKSRCLRLLRSKLPPNL